MNDLDSVALPGGTFLMGTSEEERNLQVGRPMVRRESLEDEGPRHDVEVSPFECMRYPVTRRLYAAVTGDDPLQRYFQHAQRVGWPTAAWKKDPDSCPVVWVRWLDAITFCNTLSRRKGLTPCYSISGTASAVASDDAKVEWIPSGNGYRLPTEAEWEFACRAGTSTQWSHGDDASQLSRYAWYDETMVIDLAWHKNSSRRGKIHEVGQKLPNPWGLFDMHGNVAEWCDDAPRVYGTGRVKDPRGDPLSIHRAIRGGAAESLISLTRSGARNSTVRSKLATTVGFRCVRSLGS